VFPVHENIHQEKSVESICTLKQNCRTENIT